MRIEHWLSIALGALALAVLAAVLAACTPPETAVVTVEIPVVETREVEVEVTRDVTVEVERLVVVTVPVEVVREVSVPVTVEVEVTREVPATVLVQQTVEVPVTVEVEVEATREVQATVLVEKRVEVPVEVTVLSEVSIVETPDLGNLSPEDIEFHVLGIYDAGGDRLLDFWEVCDQSVLLDRGLDWPTEIYMWMFRFFAYWDADFFGDWNEETRQWWRDRRDLTNTRICLLGGSSVDERA